MERCCAPFNQILLKPDGRATPCCYLYGYHLGSVARDGWQSAWHHTKLKRLRQEFLDGDPRTCRGRMQSIGCHKQFEYLQDITDWSVQPTVPPRKLDLRLNGQCNLSCHMCDVWEAPNGVFDQSDFWLNGPTELFPSIREVDILGGEPFVQSDTFRLIKEISAVNANCKFNFVTNGHLPWSRRIENLLTKISIGYIQVSIDAICPITYYHQRGGRIDLPINFVSNLRRLNDDNPFEIKLSFCVTKRNWWEVGIFLEWCDQLSVTPELQYAYYTPDSIDSLSALAETERKRISTAILNGTKEDFHQSLQPILKPLEYSG